VPLNKYENIMNISFGKGIFDCIVCLNGNIPGKEVFSLLPDVEIYAADGAANILIENGTIPEYIIGDMDSFNIEKYHDISKNSMIINVPDQELNDFEKILIVVLSKKLRHILIFGFHGGELEHTLNNWSVLIKYIDKLNLCIYDHGRYGIPLNRSFSINLNEDELVSLIPQPKALLKSNNLKWELNNEELQLGSREGARNRVIASPVDINVLSGSLLLFIEGRLPMAPSFSE
jgi:thiamine pyrophosphokinase